jgi:hypothetical protein
MADVGPVFFDLGDTLGSAQVDAANLARARPTFLQGATPYWWR